MERNIHKMDESASGKASNVIGWMVVEVNRVEVRSSDKHTGYGLATKEIRCIQKSIQANANWC